MLNGIGIGIFVAVLLNIIAFILERHLKEKVSSMNISIVYSVSIILLCGLAFSEQADVIPNRY
jgi:predicted PurR-regulated permease PerM